MGGRVCLYAGVWKELTTTPAHLPAPAQLERRQRWNVNGFVHNYGRDGWPGPVRAQLLPSIFLGDERGARQHPVICYAATAGNSKSRAQSHPRFASRRLGKRGCMSRRRALCRCHPKKHTHICEPRSCACINHVGTYSTALIESL